MLKVEISENGHIDYLGVSGDIPTICSDVCTTINRIYLEMKNSNKNGAEDFKELITKNIEVAFYNDEELKKKTEETQNKVADRVIDILQKILDELEKEPEDEKENGEAK